MTDHEVPTSGPDPYANDPYVRPPTRAYDHAAPLPIEPYPPRDEPYPPMASGSTSAARSPHSPPYDVRFFVGMVAVSAAVAALAGWLTSFVAAHIYQSLPAHPGWPAPHIDPAATAIWAFVATVGAAAGLWGLALVVRGAAGLFAMWLAALGVVAIVVIPFLTTTHPATALGPVVIATLTALVAINLLTYTHATSRRG
ncbi:MAG: hypothetical protein INR66_00140 [Gordonia polyisoprenivorans]|nr:hypothetical protein [Gordonia polyisoprenivorans]